ncbi:hypothetical protein [Muricoccus radiodurans]|uniref:hypothetical protein n=1 Tax=Muricoccus radiodurans TaxID=2231721 RepID=UPI003CEEE402
MQRRGFFVATLAGMLGALATPAAAQDAATETALRRRRAPRAAASPPGTECTREAPCTGPRGGRYWIDANGRRRSIRRPRRTAAADAPAR